jgi:hypothetical protein
MSLTPRRGPGRMRLAWCTVLGIAVGALAGSAPACSQSAQPLPPAEPGQRLEKSDGVIRPPPNVDPKIHVRPPDPATGSTPVIPPPGSPGGNPDVVPK